MPTTYDIHVHFAPLHRHAATDQFLIDQPNRYVRAFLRHLGLSVKSTSDPAAVQEKFLTWCTQAAIDRFVLLAMDAAYTHAGQPDPARTAWITDHDFLADLAAHHPKLLWAASVHPYRPDAVPVLQRALDRGACMVKWIPSAQQIRLDDPRCLPIYEMLAHHRVPLLVHTGHEHTSSRSHNTWNDPALLVHPLGRGVVVIAAHCGARLFLHERCYFKTFARLAREHEHLYGDLAAFGVPTRIGVLRKLRRTPDLLAKILYGSDFPAFVLPRTFLLAIGWRAVQEILHAPNPLDRPYLLMRAMGLPDEVFTRAGRLLCSAPAGVTA